MGSFGACLVYDYLAVGAGTVAGEVLGYVFAVVDDDVGYVG